MSSVPGMPRTVTLALIDPSGTVLGALPPFAVPAPWRQEVAGVGEGARRHHGVDVTVLRLLAADGEHVTYLAECPAGTTAGLRPIEVDLAPEPRRPLYAQVGGPTASLAWAADVLGPVCAVQLRTWNLSSIWRLEYGGGTAWLKEVPAFFAHEGAVIGWLADAFPGFGPVPLAVDGGRMLLADIPGEDRYGAGADERLAMLRGLHEVQRAAVAAPVAGVPELGVDRLATRIRSTGRRCGAATPNERSPCWNRWRPCATRPCTPASSTGSSRPSTAITSGTCRTGSPAPACCSACLPPRPLGLPAT